MNVAMRHQAWADLCSHRLQSFLIVLILTVAAMTLTLAGTVQRLTTEPFARLMTQTRAAHVRVQGATGADLTPLAGLDGVDEVAGPYPLLPRLELAATRGLPPGFGVDLVGMSADPAPTGRPWVTDGRWLAVDATDEIVFDPDLARFLAVRVGDRVEFPTVSGNGTVAFTLVGLAVSPALWHDPDIFRVPRAYLTPTGLTRIVPDPAIWQSVMGLRLNDPAASQAVAGDAYARLPVGNIVSVGDWQAARAAMSDDNQINVTLLEVFSLFGLLAAGLVIANAIGGRVLARYREIGLLKAIGFTPAQVTGIFLLEHLGLGLLAAGLGLAGGVALTPLLTDRIPGILTTVPVSRFDPRFFLIVVLAVEATVALCTLVPAWRGGRIGTVQAITVGFARAHTRPSRLAGWGMRLRLPVPLVLGIKDVFTRPARTLLTIAALVLTVATAVFSLGMEATIRDIVGHPERWGVPYDVLVEVEAADAAALEGALATNPAVRERFTWKTIDARLDGSGTTLATHALGGDYPDLGGAIAEGRMFAGAGEAVVGQGLLDLAGASVGDDVRLWIGDKPLSLTIVGRYVDPERDGLTALYGLETYRDQIEPTASAGGQAVLLAAGASAFGLMDELRQEIDGNFSVQSREFSGDDFVQLRAVLGGLNVVLITIGLVNLLTTTMLGVRERVRDFGVLKTIGLTPGQTVTSVVTGVATIALVAVGVGVPIGLMVTRLLFDELGRQLRIGAGLGIMPPALGLVLLVPLTVVLAVAAALLPAQRASAMRIDRVLRMD